MYPVGIVISVPVEILFVVLSLSVLFSIIMMKVSSVSRGLIDYKPFITILLKVISVYWSAQVVAENIKSYYEKRTSKLISVTNVVQGRTNNGSI